MVVLVRIQSRALINKQMDERIQETRSFRLPTTLVVSVKLLDALSPFLTNRFLLNRFFTPINFSTPQREMFFKQTCDLRREKINNKSVTIYHNGKAGPHLLFCHGWSGRSTQFADLATHLIAQGFRVTLFTAPAHGSSDDKETDLRGFIDTIKYCETHYGPFDAAIGHSLGGIAVINAFKEGLAVKRLVTISSPATVIGVVDDFLNLVGAGKRTRKRFIKSLEKRYKQPIDSPAPVLLMEGDTTPGLIVHDEDDLDASVTYAHQLHQSWNGSQLFITKGLGHRKILSDPTVFEAINAFLKADWPEV